MGLATHVTTFRGSYKCKSRQFPGAALGHRRRAFSPWLVHWLVDFGDCSAPVDFWANDRSDTTAWFCLAGYLIFHIWEEEIIDFQFLGLAQSPSRTHIFWMGLIATRERYSLTVENPTFCQVWQRQICDAGPQILWPRPTILFDS